MREDRKIVRFNEENRGGEEYRKERIFEAKSSEWDDDVIMDADDLLWEAAVDLELEEGKEARVLSCLLPLFLKVNNFSHYNIL